MPCRAVGQVVPSDEGFRIDGRATSLEADIEILAGLFFGAISTLMVVIGLFYLVVNAWWIRRSLRCPPPRLDELIGSIA